MSRLIPKEIPKQCSFSKKKKIEETTETEFSE